MKVSTRVEYGLIALTDIVLHSAEGESVSAPDISKRQHISHKYLEQILLHLRQAGLIRAQKGVRGGYVLTCPPDQISLSDVLNALDQNILARMDERDDEDGLGAVINDCFWEKINSNLNRYAKETKMSDFADQCRNRAAEKWDFYVI